MDMGLRRLGAALVLAFASCVACTERSEPGTTFAVRPLNISAASFERAMQPCLALPGVSGGPVSQREPPFFSVWAADGAVAPLRDCLANVPDTDVETVVGRPGDDLGRAEFIERCIEEARVEPDFVGMTEAAVQAAGGNVRVICKDRVFLDRTSDYQRDRLNPDPPSRNSRIILTTC